MTDVAIQLTRELGMANNTDALGKRWGIKCHRQTALYHIVLLNEEDEHSEPAHYPKNSGLDSRFTKAVLAEEAIKSHVRQSWDYNDKQVQKKERKEHKEKVELKEEKLI